MENKCCGNCIHPDKKRYCKYLTEMYGIKVTIFKFGYCPEWKEKEKDENN